jgi:serine protease Do
MGIAINPATEADAQAVGLKEIRGVRVEDFTGDDSPAKAAGIQQGDVITMLDGQPVDYVAQLQQRVGFKKPGDNVQVTVMRAGGVQKTFSVRLTAQPTDSQPSQVASKARRAPLGVSSLRSAPLGITAEPLTTDDMQDARLARAQAVGGGMVVADVSPDSPAFQQLRGQNDNGGPDIILKVNGQSVRTSAEFRASVANAKKGDIVTLVVLNISPPRSSERILRLKMQ